MVNLVSIQFILWTYTPTFQSSKNKNEDSGEVVDDGGMVSACGRIVVAIPG